MATLKRLLTLLSVSAVVMGQSAAPIPAAAFLVSPDSPQFAGMANKPTFAPYVELFVGRDTGWLEVSVGADVGAVDLAAASIGGGWAKTTVTLKAGAAPAEITLRPLTPGPAQTVPLK